MLNERLVTRPNPTAQSEKQTLSQRELKMHGMLMEQLQNLTSKLDAQTNEIAQGTFSEGDYGDLASKTARQSKRLAMERLWQSMRSEVEQALMRLEQGTYGLCLSCGLSIPEERLMVVPSATQCIQCARAQGPSRVN